MTSPTISIRRPSPPRIIVNQSASTINYLTDLFDVDTSSNQNGSILVYDSTRQLFVATRTLDNQIIDGGSY